MQILANGLIYGAAIAVLALAFQLVYLPTRILFLGIAGVYSLVPYLHIALLKYGLAGWSSALTVLAAAALVSVLFEYFNHAPLARSGAGDSAQMVSSLGLYIVVTQIIALGWGNVPMRLPVDLGPAFTINQIVLERTQVGMLIFCLLALAVSLAWLYFTRIGLQLRALADNADEFARLGYNVWQHRMAIFAMSGALTAVSALTTAADIGFSPNSGFQALLPALVAVIIGGRFSFAGAVAGGFVVGLIRTEVGWQFSSRWQDAAILFILALFLLFRPAGIVGQIVRVDTGR